MARRRARVPTAPSTCCRERERQPVSQVQSSTGGAMGYRRLIKTVPRVLPHLGQRSCNLFFDTTADFPGYAVCCGFYLLLSFNFSRLLRAHPGGFDKKKRSIPSGWSPERQYTTTLRSAQSFHSVVDGLRNILPSLLDSTRRVTRCS